MCVIAERRALRLGERLKDALVNEGAHSRAGGDVEVVQAARIERCARRIEIDVLDSASGGRGQTEWPGRIDTAVRPEDVNGAADIGRHRRRKGDIETDDEIDGETGPPEIGGGG